MNDKKPIDIPFNPLFEPPGATTTLEFEVLAPPTAGSSSLLLGMGRVGDATWVVGGLGSNVVYVSRDDGGFGKGAEGKAVKGGRGLRTLATHGDDTWVCGEWGYAARSTDGGKTWTRVPTNVNNCCWSLAIDERGGVWGTADNGWVGYCTDGETWNGVQRGVSCTNAETWENQSGMPGGVAWAQSSPLGILLPAGERLLLGNAGTVELCGLESEHKLTHAIVTPSGAIVVVGHFGSIFRSDDRGASFEAIQGPTTFERSAAKKGRPPIETNLHRVHALDDGRLIATGDRGLIMVSTDDGRSFSKVTVAWGDDEPTDQRTYALGMMEGRMLIGTGNGGILAAR